MSSLHVCVDARLVGEPGGIKQFIIGLAYGLSQLQDGNEEYFFLAYPGADDWLRPYLGGRSHLLRTSASPQNNGLKAFVRSLPFVRKLWHEMRTSGFTLPASDGTIEREQIEIMHFAHQGAFLTRVPTIYHPWDLQHLHLPEYFTPRARAAREYAYRRFCDQAVMVAAANPWVKMDLLQQYGLPESKVQVIPIAPSIGAYPKPSTGDLEDARIKFALPERFILYPAQTWPHKNHIGLLKAIAILRDERHMAVPVVLCGAPYPDFHPQVESAVKKLGLEKQVKFLGFVEPRDLQALYRLAKCVVIPTKFEGGGLPLWDAFLAGTPVACSNVTCLPGQAADAALLFDPNSPVEIANAIFRLWTDEALGAVLRARGEQRAKSFTWERTARIFRAHYRRLGGRQLTDEDRSLLAATAVSSQMIMLPERDR